ncbi:hypothetical protein LCGC14_1389190 [marine sediment metagenome]|uniref:Uncharacterized protein n=1 Tax=marine sediment metagenome TaxID=412755 RepID=A0A0F9K0H9_9ZZZZ
MNKESKEDKLKEDLVELEAKKLADEAISPKEEKEDIEPETPKVFEKKEIEKPKTIEQKPLGIKEQLTEINKKMNTLAETKGSKIKKKSFKMPGNLKSKLKNLKKLAEKSKIQVLLLKLDGSIIPTIGEIKLGMLLVGDNIHNADGKIIWRWNGMTPTAIVGEWDMQPVTIDTLTKTTEELKSVIFPQKIIIRAMELKEALTDKKGPSAKAMIWVILIVIVVVYIFFSNSGG